MRCKVVLTILFLMLWFPVSSLWAESSEFMLKEGVYIGAAVVHNTIGQDFDDSRYYYGNGNVNNVPEIDSAFGGGLFIGYRLENWAMEVSWQRVVHETHTVVTAMGDQDAVYNVVDLNIKVDVLARDRFRPFVLFGAGGTWLDIDNNRMYTGGVLTDETFEGWTVNVGGGAAYYFTPRWFLTGTVMYRWQHFKQVDNTQLSVDAMGSGMNVSLGLAYTF